MSSNPNLTDLCHAIVIRMKGRTRTEPSGSRSVTRRHTDITDISYARSDSPKCQIHLNNGALHNWERRVRLEAV